MKHAYMFYLSIFFLSMFLSITQAQFSDPTNLGPRLNSEFEEMHAVIDPSGCYLYLGSNRSGGYGDRDIWRSRLLCVTPWGSLWAPPENLGNPVNTSSFDGHAKVSSDGSTMYFISDRPGGYGNTDIWYSTREGAGWNYPENIGYPVNTSAWEVSPCISEDGQTLYFCSGREGGYGHQDLYKSTWTGSAWSTPENLGPSVNTSNPEYCPWVNEKENVLVFMSWDHGSIGMADLCISQWDGESWAKAFSLGPSINTEHSESGPFLSSDLLTVYFHSNRPGGFGVFDLYRCNLIPEQWDLPMNAGSRINSSYFEGQPNISADGTVLFFSSDRPGGQGDRDIWYSFLLGWSATGPLWSEPENLGAPPNSPYLDSDPCISADGQRLYYMSTRPPGSWDNADIWVSERLPNGGWDEPVNLGYPVNSETWDRNPSLSSDGMSLYFSSYRTGGYGNYDIYRSTWLEPGWSIPENLGPEVNTVLEENAPCIGPGESFLFFNSYGHGSQGLDDMYVSTFDGSNWTEPKSLSGGLCTVYNDGSASQSPDLGTLYYHSNRPGSMGEYDIYIAFADSEIRDLLFRDIDTSISTEIPLRGSFILKPKQ